MQLGQLAVDYAQRFGLTKGQKARVRRRLQAWKAEVTAATQRADLIGDYYDLLADCGVAGWDFRDPEALPVEQDRTAAELARADALF